MAGLPPPPPPPPLEAEGRKGKKRALPQGEEGEEEEPAGVTVDVGTEVAANFLAQRVVHFMKARTGEPPGS